MTRALTLALAMLALTGCGAGDTWMPNVLVLTPDANIRVETESVAKKVSKATGLNVFVGLGGTPVSKVPQAVDIEGNSVCGATKILTWPSRGTRDIEYIHISAENPECRHANLTERVLIHEVIHALVPELPRFLDPGIMESMPLDQRDPAHAAHGVFRGPLNSLPAEIDEPAHEIICTLRDCTVSWEEHRSRRPR